MYIVTNSGCWEWLGATDDGGYGAIYRDDEPSHKAHVAFYVRAKGPVPEGLVLDHLCRNRKCVNPDHLEPVTDAINIQRGSRTALTAEQVLEVRAAYSDGGVTQQQLADTLLVSRSAIAHAVQHRTWRNI